MLRRGQRFFQTFKVEIATALFNAGLPYTYTAEFGARVLTETAARLATSEHLDAGVVDLLSHVERRIGETGQMLLDIMGIEDGDARPFAASTAAFRAARGVRFFHAAVRHQLGTADPKWDESRFGKPVNQEDLLATLAVFIVVVMEALRKMGARTTRADRAGYVHTWLVVGHLMGIHYEQLFPYGRPPTAAPDGRPLPPLDEEELRLFLLRYTQRHCRRSDEGVLLMKALLRVQTERFPGPLKRLPPASVRYFIGKERADELEVPTGHLSLVFGTMKVFTELRTLVYHVGWIAPVVRRRTHGLYRRYIKDATRGTRPGWRIAPLRKRFTALEKSRRRSAA